MDLLLLSNLISFRDLNARFFFFLFIQSAIRVQSILQVNGLAGSLTCRLIGVMRSPPARRSRTPYYR